MTTVTEAEGRLAGVEPKDPTTPLLVHLSQQAGEQVWKDLPTQARVLAPAVVALLPEFGPRLAPVHEWSQRAVDVNRQFGQLLGEAKTGVDVARKALVADPDAGEGLVAAVDRVRLVEASRAEFGKARKALEHQAYRAWAGLQGPVFDSLAAKAAALVERVAKVPALPATVWSAADPQRVMVDAGRIGCWGVLIECQTVWGEVHRVADQLREPLGYTADHLVTGAPRCALVYRGWQPAFEQIESGEHRRRHLALRLRYAVENGWLPGVWKPAEVDAPARVSMGERLRVRAGEVLGFGRPRMDPITKIGVPPA